MCESSGCGPNDTSGQAIHFTSRPLSTEQKRTAFICLYFVKHGRKNGWGQLLTKLWVLHCSRLLCCLELYSWSLACIPDSWLILVSVRLSSSPLFCSFPLHYISAKMKRHNFPLHFFLESFFNSKDNQLLSGRTEALPVVIDIRCTHFLNSLKFWVLNVKLWQAGCGPRVSSL